MRLLQGEMVELRKQKHAMKVLMHFVMQASRRRQANQRFAPGLWWIAPLPH